VTALRRCFTKGKLTQRGAGLTRGEAAAVSLSADKVGICPSPVVEPAAALTRGEDAKVSLSPDKVGIRLSLVAKAAFPIGCGFLQLWGRLPTCGVPTGCGTSGSSRNWPKRRTRS
jgi:hypothetical protein